VLNVVFCDINGRPLRKRISDPSAPLRFCSSSLLSARNGDSPAIDGFGVKAGHVDAGLNWHLEDVRTYLSDRDTIVVADIVDNDDVTHPLCSRGRLKDAAEYLAGTGSSALVGVELEFFLWPQHARRKVISDKLRMLDSPRQLYASESSFEIRETIIEIIEQLTLLGVELISANHEYEHMQYELSLAPTNPLRAADNILLGRQVIAEVAAQRGLYACFLPKAARHILGNGLHLSLSSWRNGLPEFSTTEDGEATAVLAAFLRAISGHLAAFTAIWNSSMNSYRRLSDADFRGIAIVSKQGRRDGHLRIAESRYGGDRVEVRTPDTLTNPYLAIALCLRLMAMAAADPSGRETHESSPMLPSDLASAIEAFKTDALATEVLGRRLAAAFLTIKQSELDFYQNEVPTTDYRYNTPEIFDFDDFLASRRHARSKTFRAKRHERALTYPELEARLRTAPGTDSGQ
jgi:glutamine synthetase